MTEDDEEFELSVLCFLGLHSSITEITLSGFDYATWVGGNYGPFIEYVPAPKIMRAKLSIDFSLPNYTISVIDAGHKIESIPISGIKDYERFRNLISFA